MLVGADLVLACSDLELVCTDLVLGCADLVLVCADLVLVCGDGEPQAELHALDLLPHLGDHLILLFQHFLHLHVHIV